MNQQARWLLIAEAIVCFIPSSWLLLIGMFMVPYQVGFLLSKPLLAEGPVLVICSVIAGLIGQATLVYVLAKLFRGSPFERPLPVAGAVLLGLTPLVRFAVGGDSTALIVAGPPILASLHILFLSRTLFFPGRDAAVRGVWAGDVVLLLPMIAVAAGMFITPRVLALSGDTLAQRHATWLASRPASYDFELQISGWRKPDLLEPRRIEVRDGRVSSATYAHTPPPFSLRVYPPAKDLAWTMDMVFDELLKAHSRGDPVRAQFDARMGYVKEAYIDPEREDSSWNLEVRNFKPVATD
jgi:hypothetical protein